MNTRLFNRSMILDGGAGDADGGGNAGDGGTDDPKSGTSSGDKKTYTKAEVDAIAANAVKDRLKRERAKYDGVESKLSRLEELEREAANRQVRDAESEKQYREALELTKKNYATELDKVTTDRDKWQGLFKEVAIDRALLNAAATMNAVKPDEVATLLRARVNLDAENKPVFDDGKTIDDGVKAFLAANPHHVRSSSRTGSGTQHGGGTEDAAGGAGLSGLSADQIRKMEPAEVVRRIKAGTANPFARQAAEKEG